MIGIYKITSPSDRVYIGQSIAIERRFNQYTSVNNCKTQSKLYNSFIKHGINNHKFEVVIECQEAQLNELERYYQDLYNVIHSGLNCTLTTTSTKTGRHSEETKNKISKSHIGKKKSSESVRKSVESKRGRFNGVNNSFFGKKHTEETKINISLKNKGNKNCLGRVMSDETRTKISKANSGSNHSFYGKKRSPEFCLKLSIALKGKNTWMKGKSKSEAQKQKMSENNAYSKKVIDLNENKIYRSLKFYCDEKNLKYRTVQSNIRGLLKTNKYPFVKFYADET